MSLQPVADAVKRVKAVVQRRPDVAVHANPPAVAQWRGGTRVDTRAADKTEVTTDMPTELGGSGDRVSPGWLFRAGVASCAATSIAIACANESIQLTALEVHVGSRSDVRGLLGMSDADGAPVSAGLFDIELSVEISAANVSIEALESLVRKCLGHSPIPCVVTTATPLKLHVNATTA